MKLVLNGASSLRSPIETVTLRFLETPKFLFHKRVRSGTRKGTLILTTKSSLPAAKDERIAKIEGRSFPGQIGEDFCLV